nr:hypothetical protein [Tanacetum cinerariifolium]
MVKPLRVLTDFLELSIRVVLLVLTWGTMKSLGFLPGLVLLPLWPIFLHGQLCPPIVLEKVLQCDRHEMPNRKRRECGIRLILAPKSDMAFFTANGLIIHGSVKLPRQEPLRWPPRVTVRRLLPHARGLGLKPRREGFPSGAKKEWGLSPKAKVRVLHTAQLDVTVSSNHQQLTCRSKQKNKSRSSSSSLFCFFNREGKGTLDDLEGWYMVGDWEVSLSCVVVVSSPSCPSFLIVLFMLLILVGLGGVGYGGRG